MTTHEEKKEKREKREPKEQGDRSGIGTRRVLHILYALVMLRGTRFRSGDVAAYAHLAESTTCRYLAIMQEEGIVGYDKKERKYWVMPTKAELAAGQKPLLDLDEVDDMGDDNDDED